MGRFFVGFNFQQLFAPFSAEEQARLIEKSLTRLTAAIASEPA